LDFNHSEKCRDYMARVHDFMEEHIDPIEADYHRQLQSLEEKWVVLPIIDELKSRAKAEGLWNLFLPDATLGAGLSVTEYAPIAELTGRSTIAPEIFNCNAPDTGNMEVLYHYGSDQQKQQWLMPLLAGEIRSAFCMTEPDVASSDATNMRATATVEGDTVVLNGRKWWNTGVGHPRCNVLIFMGLTDPTAHRHSQHSMVLVPTDTPGVRIVRQLPVMNMYDEPFGHGEVEFNNVRLPISSIIAGPGRGFEIAQGRLGPGRIHHCMRLIGLAEMALKLMCQRSLSRVAFGKPLANLGGNRERIAEARIMIEQARLLVLKAAWMIDNRGVFSAMSEISQIKVVCPNVAQQVIDMAIQMHGGAGLSNDFPLASAWALARTLRLADGPDEVHRGLVARFELMKYKI
jgi:acyl-CoA dehydrogenase